MTTSTPASAESLANQTHNVHLERTFAAPVETVWGMWSNAEKVKQWWGPQGWSCPVCRMDFRESGTTLVSMRAPAEYGGFEIYNTWSYTRIEPMERIEYVLRFSDANGAALDPATLNLPPGVPSDVPHLVTLARLEDNSTRLTVTEFGYPSAETAEVSKSGMIECLDKMEASLAQV